MKDKMRAAIELGVKTALASMGHESDPMDAAEDKMEGKMELQVPTSKHPYNESHEDKGMSSDKEAKKKFAMMSLKKKFNL